MNPSDRGLDGDAQPHIIQGGMGVGVSGWKLASAVSRLGQLGVVSGTALSVVVARRLADGDPDGSIRRVLARFPSPEVAQRVIDRWFTPGGKDPATPYKSAPKPVRRPGRAFLELTAAAAFAEVALAKEGHGGAVGINLLEKIQMPTLATLYGALLAGVDYVLMGAGIPREIPAALDRLARHEPAALRLAVAGASADHRFTVRFDPSSVTGTAEVPLRRPAFLAIVSSHTLATHLLRTEDGPPDGFVIERPKAGGHNAPPRGRTKLSDQGEPVYGPRDEVDLAQVTALGTPFWLAGGYGYPERVREALALGAAGVQVGTAFALCEESGIEPSIRRRLVAQAAAGDLSVFTDPVASPTGFPFKVVQAEETLSERDVYEARARRCDLGFLVAPYRRPDGRVGYRCAGEPVDDYVSKGGDAAETTGRKCLCNGLFATVGLAQRRAGGYVEPPLITLGDDAQRIVARLAADGRDSFAARDVIEYLLRA